MATNQNRRQKKLEAKRTKRKQQQRTVARFESSGMLGRTSAAKTWPILDARISDEINENGIGYAIFARRNALGQIVIVCFLVDTYCLGVKDVAVMTATDSEWTKYLARLRERRQFTHSVPPEELRKFVEGAVEYSRSFGLEPCREWAFAVPFFGDIDASVCTKEFTYGQDGKPSFVAGPYDTQEKIQRIMSILSEKAGDGNYHFTIPLDPNDHNNSEIIEHLDHMNDDDVDGDLKMEMNQETRSLKDRSQEVNSGQSEIH